MLANLSAPDTATILDPIERSHACEFYELGVEDVAKSCLFIGRSQQSG